MSRSYIHMVVGCLLLLVTAIGCTSKKRLDERVTLWRNDKIPYGTWYAHENLRRIFPDASVKNNKSSPDPYQKSKFTDLLSSYEESGSTKAYLIISNQVLPDSKEIEGLMSLVNQGSKVFISSSFIDEHLLDSLQLKASLYGGFMNGHDSLTLKVYDPVSWQETAYSYPGKAYDNYFSFVDSSITTVLGKDANGKANFVKIAYESGGAFYIHLAPIGFSNFFLLHKNNKAYYDQVLSWMPKNVEHLYWDDYFRYSSYGDGKEGGGGAKSGFKAWNWMMQQPALAWGCGLFLLLLLLIYLFESKRKQRIIPPIAPLRNSSLDFVKTIGRMYFQRKDNKDLVHKMTTHFLSYVRGRYNIRSYVMDDEFVQRLTYKSGYDAAAVQGLVYLLQYAADSPQVTDQVLLELNHKLETFYQKA
ncbi:hypothetical protein [Paraflavitalea sp. CAU 1676]|uniref:DUF4350 domain-containing protein n=1 Tax=Paraflavitalea sp. CAU 1676 TaxID=3032598 RepID=UPI0023D9A618|nr:hypothetical protein [Paraflavitalea sp. CAU 1676]MDF2190170.1 hypothetical protein [Paraflavitalea sp. CAU 1676]